MPHSIQHPHVGSQPTSVDHDAIVRSTAVDLAHAHLRQAVKDTGHTLDSLAAHMEKDRAYIGKVLNREKPLSLDFLACLPQDVQAHYYQYRAEAFGYVVVEQMDEEKARQSFAAGLFNILAPRRVALPERSGGQAKAQLKADIVTERRLA